MHAPTRLINVAVSGPRKRTFTYLAPEHFGEIQPGARLAVPFGKQRKVGFYLGPGSAPTTGTLKSIIQVIDRTSLFSSDLFHLCIWMADYYFANPADCLLSALPPKLKSATSNRYRIAEGISHPEIAALFSARDLSKARVVTSRHLSRLKRTHQTLFQELLAAGKLQEDWTGGESGRMELQFKVADDTKLNAFIRKRKGCEIFEGSLNRTQLKGLGWTPYQINAALRTGALIQKAVPVQIEALPFVAPKQNVQNLILTDEQNVVCEKVNAKGDRFSVHLLHGVTGSGKTLVYCRLAEKVLARDRDVLVLTPEIALTGPILAYFRGFFAGEVTVIHSAMTERERIESWAGIQNNRYRVVIGPRSALFAPLKNIGLIIVDEEHDGSYKQDDPSPRFHGRDSAIMRAKLADVPIVLGSASPSIESYHNALAGKYSLHKLTRRPTGTNLPRVQIVDMRKDGLSGSLTHVSYQLKKSVDEKLSQGDQAILFLNKRGYARQLKCDECGTVSACPNCNISLTYHKVGSKLTCHYCGHQNVLPTHCTSCNGHAIQLVGTGTQRAEEDVQKLFPQAKPVRFDSDSAKGRQKAYEILQAFSSGQYNVLLGTQMVTKGLDLGGVTLVCVLDADQSLDMPDFRASEKTFARLLQVAGRSGRAKPGVVLIQTHYPEHPVIRNATTHDYEAFYVREIEVRRNFDFPPFNRLVNVVFSSRSENALDEKPNDFKSQLIRRASKAKVDCEALGPSPCPMYYLRSRYRKQMLIKTRTVTRLTSLLSQWEDESTHFGLPSTISVTVDVDPDDMM